LIESIDFYFLNTILDSNNIQTVFFGIFGLSRDLGNGDPIIKGAIPTLFAVSGFGIMISFFNSIIRKKIVDQKKMKQMMNETKEWRKQRTEAMKAKDNEKIFELNKKSGYMNKISFDIMQMNMKPMIFTFIPLILIYYFVLPQLFSNIVALSPVSLDVFPANFYHLTCTYEQALDPTNVCDQENSVYRWAWYFLSSIAFSGIVNKITNSTMGLL